MDVMITVHSSNNLGQKSQLLFEVKNELLKTFLDLFPSAFENSTLMFLPMFDTRFSVNVPEVQVCIFCTRSIKNLSPSDIAKLYVIALYERCPQLREVKFGCTFIEAVNMGHYVHQ
jgi:hypothetical protein